MKTARLFFSKADGSKVTISLKNAKSDLTEEQATTAMQAVIDNPIFAPNVTAIVGAEIVDRTVTEIIEP